MSVTSSMKRFLSGSEEDFENPPETVETSGVTSTGDPWVLRDGDKVIGRAIENDVFELVPVYDENGEEFLVDSEEAQDLVDVGDYSRDPSAGNEEECPNCHANIATGESHAPGCDEEVL